MSTRRRKEAYRIGTTLWKAMWTWIYSTFGVGAGVLTIAQPETWEEFQATWPTFLFALLPPIATAIENLRKNYNDNGSPLWSWPMVVDKIHRPGMYLAFAVILCGCATSVRSQFTESITDAETGNVTLTTLDLRSKAGIFAELDTTNQSGKYTLTEAGDWILTLGLDAEGLRNTGQVEALSVAIQGLVEMNALWAPVVQQVMLERLKAQVVPGPTPTP